MIDSLLNNINKSKSSQIHQELGISGERYAMTLHRPSNVDDKSAFIRIIDALEEIGERITIVFPLHLEPRIERRSLA